jgi:HPt (histidine-containing phosphotransfer) domain-containing protein
VTSINQKTKLYKKVYDSFMEESTSEKEQLTTSTDVDQTVETVEEICTSLLTEEKELALVKLGKANMVS